MPLLPRLLFAGLAFALAAAPAAAQTPGPAEAPFRVVHGWPQLPEGFTLGQVGGVGVDSRNRVFVFRRAENSIVTDFKPLPLVTMPAVMVFDGASGALVDSWGANEFVRPHGCTIDAQDNVWLTDAESHEIFKFSNDGKLLMKLGEHGKPGQDGTHFNKPTDIAVAADGSFYVSDGYVNSRVAKFAADGKFLFEWGKKGSGPGEFNVPHSICLGAGGKVYVVDRENARIQVFDAEGKYLLEWKSPELGHPWAIRPAGDGAFFVVDAGPTVPLTQAASAKAMRVDADGKILESFARYGNYDGQFISPHDLAVGADGAVYVGDVATGQRVQKFVRDAAGR
jgi:DNA-binding beta-propeller fold protein YncE